MARYLEMNANETERAVKVCKNEIINEIVDVSNCNSL